MSTPCGLQLIQTWQDPNDGRVIINNNFSTLCTQILNIQAEANTGSTIVTAGTNISVGLSYSGLTPIYDVSTVASPEFNNLTAIGLTSTGTIIIESTGLNTGYLDLTDLSSSAPTRLRNGLGIDQIGLYNTNGYFIVQNANAAGNFVGGWAFQPSTIMGTNTYAYFATDTFGNDVYTFPAKTGVVALISDITGGTWNANFLSLTASTISGITILDAPQLNIGQNIATGITFGNSTSMSATTAYLGAPFYAPITLSGFSSSNNSAIWISEPVAPSTGLTLNVRFNGHTYGVELT